MITLYDEAGGIWRTYRRLPLWEQCDDPLCDHPGCVVPFCTECEEAVQAGWQDAETGLVICGSCAEELRPG
jgi:hypothetical protein